MGIPSEIYEDSKKENLQSVLCPFLKKFLWKLPISVSQYNSTHYNTIKMKAKERPEDERYDTYFEHIHESNKNKSKLKI